MSFVSPLQKQAMRYIASMVSNVSLENFIEKHGPIGQVIYDDLEDEGLVVKNADGKLILTNKGQQIIDDGG